MDLSVIICTYNRCNSLASVLDNLMKQIPFGDSSVELLIIDNNSSDNTKDVVSCYQGKSLIEIRYILETRQGKNFALNTAIEMAKAKILAFTDDDVILTKDWLKNIINSTNKFNEIGFGGRVLPKGSSELPHWIIKRGKYRNYHEGIIVEHDKGKETFVYPMDTGSPPIGANMFFRKEAFNKYGLFREDLRIGNSAIGEDTEICLRLLKNNENLRYVPDVLVYHPIRHERLTRTYFKKQWFKHGMIETKYEQVSPCTKFYFAVPRFYYKMLIMDILRFCMNLAVCRNEGVFFHRLRINSILGSMYSYVKGYNKESVIIPAESMEWLPIKM